MSTGKPKFDPNNPIIRLRSEPPLKHRIERIAKRRGCDPSTFVREGPRYWLMDIIAVLERDHKPAALDPSKTRWVDFAGAEVIAGRVRRQRKAA